MYSVVIADDEQFIREAIILQVDWKSMGFTIVGEADNGADALELVERLEPDLLITDIKMPFLSGIELVRQIRDSHPGVEVVFLTGYDDFEYTKKAIQYEAADYWLKPISIEDIIRELSNLRIKLDEKWDRLKNEQLSRDMVQQNIRLVKDNFLISLVLDKKSEEKLHEALTLLDPGFFSGGLYDRLRDRTGAYQLFSVELEDGENQKTGDAESLRNIVESLTGKYLVGEAFSYDEKISVLLADEPEHIARWLAVLFKEVVQTVSRLLGRMASIGVSNLYAQPELSGAAYREAVGALQYGRDNGLRVVYISDIVRNSGSGLGFLDAMLAELDETLKQGDTAAASAHVRGMFAQIRSEKLGRGDFNVCVLEIASLVYRTIRNLAPDSAFNSKLIDGLFVDMSVEEIEGQVEEMCVNACASIGSQRQKNVDVLAGRAMEIIQNEFGDSGLSLNTLAGRLHCSSNYLSALIKKVKGETFIGLLTKRRMEYAQEQLLYSSRKIMEIAQSAGYMDQHYFSYCFKKYFGVSPNKMRENAANEKTEE